MAATKSDVERATSNRAVWLSFGALAVIAVIIVALVIRHRPPQMGADEKVFRTVDALYTAVRNRDEARVTECEQRLHSYRDAGMLPKAAAAYLDEVIAKAQAGQWESATRRLYDFMMAQRREKG